MIRKWPSKSPQTYMIGHPSLPPHALSAYTQNTQSCITISAICSPTTRVAYRLTHRSASYLKKSLVPHSGDWEAGLGEYKFTDDDDEPLTKTDKSKKAERRPTKVQTANNTPRQLFHFDRSRPRSREKSILLLRRQYKQNAFGLACAQIFQSPLAWFHPGSATCPQHPRFSWSRPPVTALGDPFSPFKHHLPLVAICFRRQRAWEHEEESIVGLLIGKHE